MAFLAKDKQQIRKLTIKIQLAFKNKNVDILYIFVIIFCSANSEHCCTNCGHVSFAEEGKALLVEHRQRITLVTEELDCLEQLRVLLVGGGGDGAAFGGNGGGCGYVVYEEVTAD